MSKKISGSEYPLSKVFVLILNLLFRVINALTHGRLNMPRISSKT